MNDTEIQRTVEAVLGKRAKIIDTEKESSFKSNDILLINGSPVILDESDDLEVKEALRAGRIPSSDLLNKIFIQLGLIKKAAILEADLSVKKCVLTTEDIQVLKEGKIVDERQFSTEVNSYCYSKDTNESVEESS